MQRLLDDAQKISGVKYDMSNLSDVYNAIHVIQENMGVTGTTAKEASSTFTGSLASMKSAWSNLLGNMSTGGDVKGSMKALVESATTFLKDNAIPMVVSIFEALPDAINVVIDAIAPKIDASMIVKKLVSGIKSFLPASMHGTFDTIVTTIQSVVTNMAPVIDTFKGIFVSAMPVVQGIIQGVCTFISGIMPTVSSVFTFVGGVIQRILNVIGEHMGLFQTIVRVAVEVVTTVWKTLAPVISAVVDVVLTVVDGLLTGIEAVFNFLAPYISKLWTSICKCFSSSSATITGIIEVIKTVLVGLGDIFSNIFSAISNTVSSAVRSITDWLSGAINTISGFIDKIGSAMSKVKDFLGSGFNKAKNALGFAYGKDRVPYDNYPARLHAGEKVLTRNQADQYDRMMSTRGVQLTQNVSKLSRDENLSNSSNSKVELPQQKETKSTGNTTITIDKLADTVVIEKEADVDKVVEDMINKFRKLVPNMA